MILRPVAREEEQLVAAWLGRKETYQWLDFGHGSQRVTPIGLKVMLRNETNVCRVYTADGAAAPIGLVALSQMSQTFRTAMLWYVLGEWQFGGQGYTSRAVSELLTLAFTELGLRAIHAWAVEENAASIRVLERNGFRLFGRQRQCHYIDGQGCDRLLFDLLATEHAALVAASAGTGP